MGILTAGVASCDSLATLPDDQIVGIEIHQAFANLESSPPMLTFTVRVSNHGNQPIYLQGSCHPRLAVWGLEKWIGDEWQVVYGEGCVFGRPWAVLRLGPGEVYETTFRVPWSEAVYPSLEVEALPGRYRAEFRIGRSIGREGGDSSLVSDLLPVEFTRVEFEVPDP